MAWLGRGRSGRGDDDPRPGDEPPGDEPPGESPKVADLDPADVLARTYLRVLGESTLPPSWRTMFGYARPVCGDLVELLALDFPDSVTMLRDEDVERIGYDEPARGRATQPGAGAGRRVRDGHR